MKEAQNPAVEDRKSWRRQLSRLHLSDVVLVAENKVVDRDTWFVGVD